MSALQPQRTYGLLVAFFFFADVRGLSLSGLGGVFTAAFSEAMKRRCVSSSLYRSSNFSFATGVNPYAQGSN
jgi:hypothetical protein